MMLVEVSGQGLLHVVIALGFHLLGGSGHTYASCRSCRFAQRSPTRPKSQNSTFDGEVHERALNQSLMPVHDLASSC